MSDTRMIGRREATNEKGAAEYLGGYAPGTLRGWRTRGIGPKYVKLGPRKVLYYIEDLDAWIAEQAVESPRGV